MPTSKVSIPNLLLFISSCRKQYFISSQYICASETRVSPFANHPDSPFILQGIACQAVPRLIKLIDKHLKSGLLPWRRLKWAISASNSSYQLCNSIAFWEPSSDAISNLDVGILNLFGSILVQPNSLRLEVLFPNRLTSNLELLRD